MRLPLPSLRSVADLPKHWPAPRATVSRPAPFQPCMKAHADCWLVLTGASGNDLCAADIVSLCKPKTK